MGGVGGREANAKGEGEGEWVCECEYECECEWVRRLLLILTSQVDRLIYTRAWPVRCAACAGAGALHCALAFAGEGGRYSKATVQCTDARADGLSAGRRRRRGARRLAQG